VTDVVPDAAATTFNDPQHAMTGASPSSRVAVVIPCYGQAHLLPEAIESVCAQTHAVAELIIVDDGSPDDVAAVARRHPDARYIRQENQGLAAARNTGLRAATAEYVVFLDADDRLMPDAVAAGLACFAGCPDCAFVFGNFRFIAEDGTPGAERVRPPVDGGDLYHALLRQNHVEMTSTVMFRRDLLAAEGGFRRDLRSAEDYELLLRLARSHPARWHDALVAEYRRYAQSGASLSNAPARMLTTTMRVLHAQWPYVRGDARRTAALRRGIRFFQDYYGGELIDHTRALARAGAWGRAAGAAAILLRHYPRGIITRIARRTRNALHIAPG
jgi:glycosyltransferase involved in cell wall biosynthesis